MSAPVDDRPVYPDYDTAVRAQDRQLNNYGVFSGIVTRPDGTFQLRFDLNAGRFDG